MSPTSVQPGLVAVKSLRTRSGIVPASELMVVRGPLARGWQATRPRSAMIERTVWGSAWRPARASAAWIRRYP